MEEGPAVRAVASPEGPHSGLEGHGVVSALEGPPPALGGLAAATRATADATGAAGDVQPGVGLFSLSSPIVESEDSLATPLAPVFVGPQLHLVSQDSSMGPLHLSSMDLSLPLAQPRPSSPALSPASQRGARSRSPRLNRSASAAAAVAIAALDEAPFQIVGNRGRGGRKRVGEGSGRKSKKKNLPDHSSRSASPPSQHISDDSFDGSTQ